MGNILECNSFSVLELDPFCFAIISHDNNTEILLKAELGICYGVTNVIVDTYISVYIRNTNKANVVVVVKNVLKVNVKYK